jgi:homoserine/homoserine lactone efflux protein
MRLLLLFSLTELVLCLTPGPAVMLVVSQGVKNGFPACLRGVAGIMTGNTVYFTLSAMGLGALLVSSATLFQIIKWTGAAYLVFLGLKMLLSGKPLDEAEDAPREKSSARLFRDGLITQLSNPKAIVFFSALLPQFMRPGVSVVEQMAVLGIISLAIEFVVLFGYGWAADRGSRMVLKGRFALLTDRIAGSVLVCAGIGLAATRRL